MLAINEVFQTLQGEATHTGSPALFVRLQGCGVACPWCDTKMTWEFFNPAKVVSLVTMLNKVDAADTYALVTPAELAAIAITYPARLVVITGGEPCAQDLTSFTAALIAAGKLVQVETSGTQPVNVAPGTWVTVSPKIGMPGGYVVRQDAVDRADEIKMPVGSPRDVERLQRFLEVYRPAAPVWVQPLSRSAKATALCIEAATLNGWRISIQVHAFIGVR